MNRIADDYPRIAAELKRIEEEKAKVLSVPLPEVQPIFDSWKPTAGYIADYDPA